jgi:4-hydroxy-tetrahydrodipicolinate synthase
LDDGAYPAIRGTFPVLPTIFDANGKIDEAGFAATIEFAIAARCDGIVFPGLASEYDHLTIDERNAMIALVATVNRGRVTFIVGASSAEQSQSTALGQAGAAAGAKAIMALPPSGLNRDLTAIAHFYAALGGLSGLPIMLQNAPSPMGLGLSPAEVSRIVTAVGGIRWIKEETQPCGQAISAHIANAPSQIEGIFGGAGGRHVIDELGRGAVGTMPAVEVADIHANLVAAWFTGNQVRARDLYERMLPILTMQGVFRWHLTKMVLRQRGIIGDAFVRAPGPRLDATDEREVATLLDRLAHDVSMAGMSMSVAPVEVRAL